MPNDFDVKKYLGTWYEQGSTPLWFSRGCSQTKAKYSLRKGGKVRVFNTCRKDGKLSKAEGVAETTDQNGLLRVGFFPLIKADYKIEYVDSGYENAIVRSGKSVWMLTRKKEISERRYSGLVARARKLGIDTSNVVRTVQGKQADYKEV